MAQDSTQYVVNPDVSCREEGPGGALLFNPDTDQVTVVNVTGWFIWEALQEPRTRDQVADVLKTRCANVPEDELPGDVSEFIDGMVDKGFVGIYSRPVG